MRATLRATVTGETAERGDLAVATDTRAVGVAAAIAIGGNVGLGALFGEPTTGGSMNPARAFGPALASGTWTDFWIHIVGRRGCGDRGACVPAGPGRASGTAALMRAWAAFFGSSGPLVGPKIGSRSFRGAVPGRPRR
jgi:Major intrinsic protein